MDTKRLLELAQDAGINVRHDDAYHDCVEPWLEAMLSDPEEMAEHWLDALAEIDGDNYNRIINQITTLRASKATIKGYSKNGMQTNSIICGASFALGFIGMEVSETIEKYMRKYVEAHAEEMWEEVCGYAGDMESAMADDHADYLHQERQDRRLDERA